MRVQLSERFYSITQKSKKLIQFIRTKHKYGVRRTTFTISFLKIKLKEGKNSSQLVKLSTEINTQTCLVQFILIDFNGMSICLG